ncbi:Chaperone protein DnaJ [Diplonema papillatum]|nr:Chaperone protein DnaJ [Diplonema papillatum]KAJ9466107.1 Chaperone protein DnaJ [Diplonema papillatum]
MVRFLLVALALLVGEAAGRQTYYEILEVSPFASSEDIKKSFRQLARQYHPDLHDDKDAMVIKMKEINEAKETLMDPDKRESYNRLLRHMQSVASLAARATGGGDLPTVVLMYLTCPAYLSFCIGSFLASFLCSTMLLAHIPAVVACYLFYKYSEWGPVPPEKRPLIALISVGVRLIMLAIFPSFVLIFALSTTEYVTWIFAWFGLPCLVGAVLDATVCVGVKVERKNVGPAGAPKTVRTPIHQRPEWLPYFCSLHDASEAVSQLVHSHDYHPVVFYEYTRTAEIERRMRQSDFDELAKAETDKQAKEEEKKRQATLERDRTELLHRKRTANISYGSADIKNSAEENGAAPVKKPAPTKKAAALAKKTAAVVTANVTSTHNAAWSAEQQEAFEKALRKHPTGSSDRWDAVAGIVPNKTARECADRFKELSSLRTQLGTRK